MQTKCILFSGVQQVTVDFAEIPAPEGDEVLLETAYTAISPGTEGRTLNGMQAGAGPWPLIPGYCLVGKVIACGPLATMKLGTYVFAGGTQRASRNRTWGGQVGHAVVSQSAVIPLGLGVDLVSASLTKLAAIAWHGARVSNSQPGETVAVVGLGVIGQLSARSFQARGANVVAGDLSKTRVEIAVKAGVDAIHVDPSLSALKDKQPSGFNIVVDSTGVPAAFPSVLTLAKDLAWNNEPTSGAKVVVQGSYPDAFSVPYDACFRKELSIIFPRDTQKSDLTECAERIADGRLAVRDLVGAVLDPEEAPSAYERLRTDPSVGTFVFRWNGAQ